jgi:DNA-binding transcriptional MocR family regulator
MQQIRHAVEVGVLRSGDQLPGIRTLAEEIVVSHTTVAKAYRNWPTKASSKFVMALSIYCGQKQKPWQIPIRKSSTCPGAGSHSGGGTSKGTLLGRRNSSILRSRTLLPRAVGGQEVSNGR